MLKLYGVKNVFILNVIIFIFRFIFFNLYDKIFK